MDRIDKNADGSFEIIDYKTKRKMPGQKEIDSDLQMSIYQLGLMKKWPHIDSDKIKLSFYFLQARRKNFHRGRKSKWKKPEFNLGHHQGI